eukprot:scaffold319044_cov35-Prasinocladus_malaysianus.AAC.1
MAELYFSTVLRVATAPAQAWAMNGNQSLSNTDKQSLQQHNRITTGTAPGYQPANQTKSQWGDIATSACRNLSSNCWHHFQPTLALTLNHPTLILPKPHISAYSCPWPDVGRTFPAS